MAKDPAFLNTDWYCINDFSHVAPTMAGVYAIFLYNPDIQNKTLMYIGMAINLKRRLNSKHEIIRTLNALNFIHKQWVVSYVKEIYDPIERKKHEKHLIKTEKPLINGS